MMRKFAKLLMEVDSANMELNAEALTWHMSELLHSVRSLIDYEKNVVFPLAKETLDDAEQERLYSLAIEMDKAHAFERIQGKQILLNPVLARA
jgi:hemerythrin-like domain-containing protein